MFTGLVETTGRVERLSGRDDEVRLRVAAPFAREIARGESVAVDGVCLTAVGRGAGWFEAVVSPETLSRTTLGLRAKGDRVNLERSLRTGDRLGGHIVQGHVDGVGVVERVAPEGSGRRIVVRIPGNLEDYVVLKGSIAVDGVSLTVAARGSRRFEAALIPETLEVTRLGDYAAGTAVNLEVDMMARYVVEYLRNHASGRPAAAPVTRDHLARHGFGKKDGAR